MRTLEKRTREPSNHETAATSDVPAEDAARARQAERRELARELHDTVVQPLTALLISMEHLSQPGEGEISEAQMAVWKSLAREAVQSLRGTMAGLRTHPHAQLGLPDALRLHLLPQVRGRGLRVTFQASGWPMDLPEDWTTSLYLTVREALMNVEKHAQASECAVLVRADARQLFVAVVDDGVGFRASRASQSRPRTSGTGFGLGGMRDRVRQLGGRLVVTSPPGHGTRIEMKVPRTARGQFVQGMFAPAASSLTPRGHRRGNVA
jgi:two-component system sensor histidine kinase UhpB